jgi:integrase
MAQSQERKELLEAVNKYMYRCPACGEWVIRTEPHHCKGKRPQKRKKARRNPPPNVTGMKLKTHAIKELEDIQKFKEAVKTLSKHDFVSARDYCIVIWMLNSNLRCIDVTRLRYEDMFIDDRGTKRRIVAGEYFEIVEKKTKKARKLYINKAMEEALEAWLEHRTEKDGWLFVKMRGMRDQLSTRYISGMIDTAGKKAGIQKVSAHSLRKTHGRYLYEHCGVDIATLMVLYNHSSPRITLTYLDIDDEEIKQAFMNEL